MTVTVNNSTISAESVGLALKAPIDSPVFTGAVTLADYTIAPKAQNTGIKVDVDAPTWGWADLIGTLITDVTGANAPTIAEYKTGVFDLGYNASDRQYWKFHLTHQEVIGGDKFIHPHLRHNGTSISGNLVLTLVISHEYGHNRAGSPAPITLTITVVPASLPRHETHIPDVLFMKSGGGAGFLNSDNILPDDDILVTMTVTTLPTISGGLSARLFIPMVDIHREVTAVAGTKRKDPSAGSFYV